MKSDDLKQPVNRREFLESTGRHAAALGLVREEMTFLSPEDVEKILGLNAARVWNLSS